MTNSDIATAVLEDIAVASDLILNAREPRAHLGISKIGEDCERALVYGFRWIGQETFSPRMLRLFDRGHLEELRLIRWLRFAGYTVLDTDPLTGDQFRVTGVNGHFGSAIDAKISHPRFGSEVFLGEFKTIATGPFEKVRKSGVKSERPKHWAQMCAYGWYYNIPRAMYFSVNKNDDDVDVQVLDLDFELGEAQFLKAARVIGASSLPARISDTPAFFKCKICDFAAQCHHGEPHNHNCRSCTYAVPIENKKWACSKFNTELSREQQLAGCPLWVEF